MASIVLSAAGNAVLPGIGGALLGTVGKFAGGIVDQQLGLASSRKFVGPRLDNLKMQDSRYGSGIPLLFGRSRVAGQVIWSSDLIETSHEDSIGGGKGGGGSASSLRYSYSVSVAIAIAHGMVSQLAAVWADGKQIYDGVIWKTGLASSISFYAGDDTQQPDAVLQASLGIDNVPAYRGIAYLVFEQMQLADFGNRLPNLTFEVIAAHSTSAPKLFPNSAPNVENSSYATLGGTPPLIISGTSRNVRQVLVAGMQNSTSANSHAAFIALHQNVLGNQPEETSRIVSPVFALNAALAGLCWALSPDGHMVAWLATSSASPTMQATLILYDCLSQQFGTPIQLSVKNFTRSIVWLDTLHFAFADHDGNALGLQIFVRQGFDITALGFYNVWGEWVSCQPLYGWNSAFYQAGQ